MTGKLALPGPEVLHKPHPKVHFPGLGNVCLAHLAVALSASLRREDAIKLLPEKVAGGMPLVRSVDAHSFVSFRVARGWTQEELSRRSGYSIRLIRKAESGGSLRIETLNHLCQSFSQEGGEVRLEDITTSILSVARTFIDAYDRFGANMIEHCRGHLHEEFSYTIHADRSTVPYGGTWNGIAGLQEMLNIFFSIFTRNPGWLQPEYMVGNSRVHARFLDQAYYQGELTPLIVINLHFEFRGLKIFKLDNEFDSDLTKHTITSRLTTNQSRSKEE